MSIRKLHENLFGRFWNPTLVLTLAGVLAAFYFGLTGTLWAVTGEFTRWGGNILQLFGVDPTNWSYFKAIKLKGGPLSRTDGWLVIGMFLGSLFSALMSRNFKFRLPRQKRRWLWSFVGGLMAGFGTRLAMGCNLAAFFSGLPQFSLHAWLFIVGTAIGTFLGVKLAVLPIFKGKPRIQAGIHPFKSLSGTPSPGRWQPYVGGVVAIMIVLFAIYNMSVGTVMLGLALLFGAIFGLLIAQGQICFTSGLRDLWLLGEATLAKAIIIGMAIQTVGTAIFIYKGVPPIIHWASSGAFIGGILFGVGIVIAGACETGWMYRLMEGQVQFFAVGVGNIIGATILAYGWDHFGVFNAFVKGWPQVNLISSFGWTGALLATGAFLGILYILVIWRETVYKKNILKERRALSNEFTA